MHRALNLLLLRLVSGLAPAAPAAAEDFYKGKTITLVVANAAGDGYDLYARLLARACATRGDATPRPLLPVMPERRILPGPEIVGGTPCRSEIYPAAT
jgi:hypothetical protein